MSVAQPNEVHAKGYKGVGMEGSIARWYAKNTAKTLGEFKECAIDIAKRLADGNRVLEVAPGPGYLAVELAKLGRYQIAGFALGRSLLQKNSRARQTTGLVRAIRPLPAIPRIR